MAFPSRVVFDTNILVSALLSTDSRPRQVFRLATSGGILLASDVTLAEVEAVLLRDKFEKWLSIEVRKEFLASYRETVQLIPIVSRLQVCRDPGDDKFLELAVDGNADLILTGDGDMLALNPFQGIRILTPQEFLSFSSFSQ